MRKKLFIILAMIVALSLAVAGAWALSNQTQSGAAFGKTRAEVVAPGDSNARLVVYGADATSDKSAATFRVYWKKQAPTTVDATSTNYTLNITSTSGFAAGDIVVIQTAGGSAIERAVSAVGTGLLILDNTIPSGYGTVGTLVYRMAAGYSDFDAEFAVSATTANKSNDHGVYRGPRNSPLLFILDGTLGCSINYVTWGYAD